MQRKVVKCIIFSDFLGIRLQTSSFYLLSANLKDIRVIFVAITGVGMSTAPVTASVECSSNYTSLSTETGFYFPAEKGPEYCTLLQEWQAW